MHDISRREFVALAAASAAAPFALSRRAGSAAVTAQDIVDRIRKNVGVDWKTDTVDTFKAGDPAAAVTGIVTTALPTIEVLKRAVKAGANFVITCEPTFYARADSTMPPAGRGAAAPNPAQDRVFAAKNEFIARNNLVVWRFSDHWRLRKPDPLAQGLVEALGWSRFRSPDDHWSVSIPAVRLEALAAEIKDKLNVRGGMRVVGDRAANVQRIGVVPGNSPIQASLKALPAVDVIVAGEVREWESVEYARDTVTAGGRKGLILVGRVLSEEPGMNVCAQWLKTLVPEVKTTWIAAGDPYWRPL